MTGAAEAVHILYREKVVTAKFVVETHYRPDILEYEILIQVCLKELNVIYSCAHKVEAPAMREPIILKEIFKTMFYSLFQKIEEEHGHLYIHLDHNSCDGGLLIEGFN